MTYIIVLMTQPQYVTLVMKYNIRLLDSRDLYYTKIVDDSTYVCDTIFKIRTYLIVDL